MRVRRRTRSDPSVSFGFDGALACTFIRVQGLYLDAFVCIFLVHFDSFLILLRRVRVTLQLMVTPHCLSLARIPSGRDGSLLLEVRRVSSN